MLAQMAEETPPMPADFHEKWTAAVRAVAEAESGGKRRTEDPAPLPAEEPGEKRERTGRLRRLHPAWRGLISAAAVMIFLVGGTLLTRDAYREETLRQETAAQKSAVAPLNRETPVPVPAAGSTAENSRPVFTALPTAWPDSAATGMPEAVFGESAEYDAAAPMMASFSAAEETAEDAGVAAEAEEPESGEEPAAEAEESADAAPGYNMAAEARKTVNQEAAGAETAAVTAAEPARETAKEEAAAAEEAAEEAPDAAPEPAKEPTETEVPEDETAPAGKTAAEDSGDPAGAVKDFVRDMGRFALQVAPWVLAAGACIAAGRMLEKRRRKR